MMALAAQIGTVRREGKEETFVFEDVLDMPLADAVTLIGGVMNMGNGTSLDPAMFSDSAE